MKIILEKERPISWNTFYSGKHWTTRNAIASQAHKLVHLTLFSMGIKPQDVKVLFKNRVTIKVSAFFDRNPLDADNIPAKLYIDGLKEMLIRDDANKYVSSVTTASFLDRERPRVEIDVEEV